LRPFFGLQPTAAGRSITGITWPRMLVTPIMCGVEPATAVTVGITMISRTLNTLMPNSSR
jgi:hypothetical protein